MNVYCTKHRAFESPTDWAAENRTISLIKIVILCRIMWCLALYNSVLIVSFRLVQKAFHLLISTKSYSCAKVAPFFSPRKSGWAVEKRMMPLTYCNLRINQFLMDLSPPVNALSPYNQFAPIKINFTHLNEKLQLYKSGSIFFRTR